MSIELINNKSYVSRIRILSLVFFLSGISALIYQVVWQRGLTLYYGVGSVSVTLIVSVYMLGLGFGALAGGSISERLTRRTLSYFIIEFLIGLFGLFSLGILSWIGERTAGQNYWISFWSMFAYLCFPTFLMGMTLPILTKIFNERLGNFLFSVSHLYFVNTIGAAFGAIFASFIAISFFGLDGALYMAVGLNFFLAIIIFFISKRPSLKPVKIADEPAPVAHEYLGRKAIGLVLVSGFLAIGYEIVWFRLIGVLIKASPYAFSSILFIYLLGIALGSFWMWRIVRRRPELNKKRLFFGIQFLLALTVAAILSAYYYLTLFTDFDRLTIVSTHLGVHPPLDWISSLRQAVAGANPFLDSFVALDIFFWPLLFLFIPTLMMGATFPLISYLSYDKSRGEGRTIGSIYFFTLLGNVLGGIVTGLILLPVIGTGMTLLIFIVTGLLFGYLMRVKREGGRSLRLEVTAILIVVVLTFPSSKGQLYALMHPYQSSNYETFFEEGVHGTVMTYVGKTELLNFINGLIHGVRPGYTFIYETMEALRYHQHFTDVLVIGFGTGSFVETLLRDSNVERVTLVELNSALLTNLAKIPALKSVLDDPKLEIIIDDGRRYLIRNERQFDLVMIDPLRQTTANSNNLYSREFFETIDRSLSDSGIFLVWADEIPVVTNTLASVFPQLRLTVIDQGDHGFFLASRKGLSGPKRSLSDLLASYSQEERHNIIEVRSRLTPVPTDRLRFDREFPINEDLKPVNEYYLGRPTQ